LPEDALPERGASGAGGVTVVEAPFGAAGVEAVPLSGSAAAELSGSYPSKNSHQAGSTAFLSWRYCSYNSSTSHSFAPKTALTALIDSDSAFEDTLKSPTFTTDHCRSRRSWTLPA
jgi:hypothetical protein